MKSIENKNVQAHSHSGHRERMKEKILKNGFTHLYDHELLETILFYAIPRRDTNQLAHELIEHFGSLNALLEADVDRIAECPGMGESSALLLKAIMECVIRYDNASVDPICYYDQLLKVSTYACSCYTGVTKEQAIALLFNNKMQLLDRIFLGEGTFNSASVNLHKLTEAIMLKQATGVVLVHNHPNGILSPSGDDSVVTRQVYDFLKQISITLIEHLIVKGKESYPIMHYSGLYDIEQMKSDHYGEEFFHRFYQVDRAPLSGLNR